jgi:hypothetical protein
MYGRNRVASTENTNTMETGTATILGPNVPRTILLGPRKNAIPALNTAKPTCKTVTAPNPIARAVSSFRETVRVYSGRMVNGENARNFFDSQLWVPRTSSWSGYQARCYVTHQYLSPLL